MNLKQILVGELIGLARACNMHPKTEYTTRILIYSLMMAHPSASVSEEELQSMITKVQEEKRRIAPGCASCMAKCGNTDPYDLSLLGNDVAADLKTAILTHLYEYAVSISESYMDGKLSEKEEGHLYQALCAVSYDMEASRYLAILEEV